MMGSEAVKHKVVCLEGRYCKIPTFDFPHEYVEYDSSEPHQIAERAKDATIIIVTVLPLTAEVINGAPRLQLITTLATGVDCIDLEACRKKGILVSNCQGSNVGAVSEHAISLYFAVRRRTVELHNIVTRTDEWMQKGTLVKQFGGHPKSCSDETLGIIGYGGLGKRVEDLAKGLGMKVVVAERKGATFHRADRVPLPDLLANSTVVVICCPRDPSTISLIGEAELKTMRKDAIVVNVARGRIVDESAIVEALKEGSIAGYGTDVFADEPAQRGVSPLLPPDGDIPNLVVSPHLAWFAGSTISNLQRLMKENVESYFQGDPKRVVCPTC